MSAAAIAQFITFVALTAKEDLEDNTGDIKRITFPALVDNQGTFVSHVGSKSGPISSLNEEQSKDEDVHLEIPVFQSQRLRLHLWKNRKFTAPGFVIEKGGQIRHYNPNCHFEGIILDQPNSSVSISFCQGLVSFKANVIFFYLLASISLMSRCF